MNFLGRYSVGLLGLAIAASIVACDNIPREADITWIEPVVLQSGDMVSIKRHVVFVHERALGGGFASAPRFSTSSIELMPADPGFPMWDAPLVPIVLDKDSKSGEWIVIASTESCDIWRRNASPKPAYWAFRNRDGIWYRDNLPAFMVGRVANLFVSFRVTDTSESLVQTLADRKVKQKNDPTELTAFQKVEDTTPQFGNCGRAVAMHPGELYDMDLRKFARFP